MQIIAILAMDHSLLIGAKNGLPWHIPEDMKRFKGLTTGEIVVMGRNTYFSLPEKFRPLPNRRNIVITRTEIEWIESFGSIDWFIESMNIQNIEKCYIIWWASLYDQFFKLNLIDQVELTLIDGKHEWDIFVSEFRSNFHEIASVDFEQWKFVTLIRNS